MAYLPTGSTSVGRAAALNMGNCPAMGLSGSPGWRPSLLALFVAQRARAGIAQEGKAVDAAMPVLPLDLHAGAGGDVDFTRFRICDWVHDDVWLAACESTL